MKKITRVLGFSFSFIIEPVGTAGGDNFTVEGESLIAVERSAEWWVEACVREEGKKEWKGFFVYASCEDDFNDISHKEEKEGGNERSEGSMSLFRDFISNIGAIDLGFVGYPYTWWNRRSGTDNVECGLDRVLCSPQWGIENTRAACLHLNMVRADHCPILLHTCVHMEKVKRRYRWVGKDGCEKVVRLA
ncbi:hypothetical protein LIER_35781 [Lithospermum erythrorhizon]|uniref:Uncharacterized protein n=1 Tax=Lithospermum erythrorhizon TaxID=34254 RepID=A0AAV3NY39_LITER